MFRQTLLVVRKDLDWFGGGDSVHAAFNVQKHRGGVCINVIVLKYIPSVCSKQSCCGSDPPSSHTLITLLTGFTEYNYLLSY